MRDFRKYLIANHGRLWWLRHPRIYWSPSERMTFAGWVGIQAAMKAMEDIWNA